MSSSRHDYESRSDSGGDPALKFLMTMALKGVDFTLEGMKNSSNAARRLTSIIKEAISIGSKRSVSDCQLLIERLTDVLPPTSKATREILPAGLLQSSVDAAVGILRADIAFSSGDEREGWMQYSLAALPFGYALGMAKERSIRAKGAAVKLAKDPKQTAKAEIQQMYEKWMAGELHFASGAAFCRAAVQRHPAIEDAKSIETWIRRWKKHKAS